MAQHGLDLPRVSPQAQRRRLQRPLRRLCKILKQRPLYHHPLHLGPLPTDLGLHAPLRPAIQIARNLTTYESMRGHLNRTPPPKP